MKNKYESSQWVRLQILFRIFFQKLNKRNIYGPKSRILGLVLVFSQLFRKKLVISALFAAKDSTLHVLV